MQRVEEPHHESKSPGCFCLQFLRRSIYWAEGAPYTFKLLYLTSCAASHRPIRREALHSLHVYPGAPYIPGTHPPETPGIRMF